MLKIRQARPFFLKGNRNFSSSRPHQEVINHNLLKFLKIGEARPFFFKEIAIFHQVAPIKNLLTIILCARSAENFWIHHWFCMNFLKKFFCVEESSIPGAHIEILYKLARAARKFFKHTIDFLHFFLRHSQQIGARSAENFWIHHWFCMNFLKKFFV